MAANREECFAALFAKLETIEGFVFKSRVWQSWDDTPPAETPALFMAKGDEEATVIKGMPPLWKLAVRVIIYCLNDKGPDEPPSVQINRLLTALESVLERSPLDGPSPDARFPNLPNGGDWGTTLGGLCYGCQISGTVQVFEGLIGDAAMVVVPIDILTTA